MLIRFVAWPAGPHERIAAYQRRAIPLNLHLLWPPLPEKARKKCRESKKKQKARSNLNGVLVLQRYLPHNSLLRNAFIAFGCQQAKGQP
jgi:hypothetical protein